MNIREILIGTLDKDPELMKKIVLANDVTLAECCNAIKKTKTIINYHCSNYSFQQENYNAKELSGALIDLYQLCQIITNKLNEFK